MKNIEWDKIEELVLEKKITKKQILEIYKKVKINKQERIKLFIIANCIKKKYIKNKVELCSIINAKSGGCKEDCKFCSQSIYNKTKIKIYSFIKKEKIIQQVEQAIKNKADEFCIVTSGGMLSKKDFENLINIIRFLKANYKIKLGASVGRLSLEQLKILKQAGLDRFNHNIETSKNYYSKIVTTHKFNSRVNMAKNIKRAGIGLCCGVLWNLGETIIDRIDAAYTLKKLDPQVVPINILRPFKNGFYKKSKRMKEIEVLINIALYRLILPDKIIKICGGREYNLRKYKYNFLYIGADSLMIGNYLTTPGAAPEKDLHAIKKLGLSV